MLENARIEGGEIVIRIPIEAIPLAHETHPDCSHSRFRIVDAGAFARELVTKLLDEDEQGGTRIYQMLDAAVHAAIDDGAEGVEESDSGDDR